MLCEEWLRVERSGGGSFGPKTVWKERCLISVALRVARASVCSTDEVVLWRVGNGRVSRGPEEGVCGFSWLRSSVSVAPLSEQALRSWRVVWGMAACGEVGKGEFWVSHGCGPLCRSRLRMQH